MTKIIFLVIIILGISIVASSNLFPSYTSLKKLYIEDKSIIINKFYEDSEFLNSNIFHDRNYNIQRKKLPNKSHTIICDNNGFEY
jgi:hypothetical protein